MEFSQLFYLFLLHTSSLMHRGTSVCFLPYQACIYICEENSTSSAKNLYLIVVIKLYFLSSKHAIRQDQLLQMTHSNRQSKSRLFKAFELLLLQRCTKMWSQPPVASCAKQQTKQKYKPNRQQTGLQPHSVLPIREKTNMR